MIKLLDITRQDKILRKLIFEDIKNVVMRNQFILGKEVSLFEKEFAKYCNTKYAIGVGNGTDALLLALKALNLKKNSEVILPAMTWKSTLLCVLNLNLKPVLVDIEKNTSNFDIDDLKKKITKRTSVIIGVHLYGNPINIIEINKLVKKHRLILVEDSAQAHGAYIGNKKTGSIGKIACFSFYPGKNLGAYGDGGCITTNDEKLAKKIMALRNCGSIGKYDCEENGNNSRLDTIQAVILKRKLKNLDKLNKKRRLIAKIYEKKITNKYITKLNYYPGCVYHQYIIKTEKRNKLKDILTKNKIQYGFHYPISINKLKIVKSLFKNQKFPNAESIAKKSISIPIDPNLTNKEINKICNILNSLN